MMNRNISPWEKECIRKRKQRRHWSPEMSLKVQEYDRNQKRQQAQQTLQSTSKGTPSESEKKRKFKVSIEQHDHGFKKSVKKLFTVGLNSPRKRDFLFDYFEQHGIKLGSDDVSKKDSKFDKNVSILQLKAFKLQNRVKDHKKMVCKIKDIYGSLNKASKALKIHYCTLWHLCQSPKTISNKQKEQMKCKMETLSQFYQQKSVTTNVPTARQSKKQFLTTTYEEAHAKYIDWCKSNKQTAVPFSTFYRLKPQNVYSVGKIPENQCCCKLCQNFKLDKIAIHEANIKGIGSTTTEIVLGSMCPVTDTGDGVIADFEYYNCISRNCKNCGKKKTFVGIYKEKILKANPGIFNESIDVETLGVDNSPIKKR